MQLQNPTPSLSALQAGVPASTQLSAAYDIWASEHLEDFAGRMALNGMAVSGVRLRNDAAYTLRQLATARETNDETLCQMAKTLFRQFERNRSTVPSQSGA